MSTPRVHSLHHPESGTWSHVVADVDAGVAAIIDPVLGFDIRSGRTDTAFAQLLLDAAEKLACKVEWILETHAHAEHMSAAAWLKAGTDAPIGIGAGIGAVQATFKPVFNLDAAFATDGSQFDHLFVDGERFRLGGIACEVIATPGHTSDGISYLVGDAVFVGDSLFMPDAGTARCDFPGGDAGVLYRSVQRLFSLPDATRVFVCHDYAPCGRDVRGETTIGAQKSANIHVHVGTDENSFITMRQARDATLAIPALMLPAVQVNIRAGQLPEPEGNGIRYLKIPRGRS